MQEDVWGCCRLCVEGIVSVVLRMLGFGLGMDGDWLWCLLCLDIDSRFNKLQGLISASIMAPYDKGS